MATIEPTKVNIKNINNGINNNNNIKQPICILGLLQN